jgi:hypothetical protein
MSEPKKKLRLTSKAAVELVLSVLSNRGMAYLKLKNFGRAFQDASLGISIYQEHEADLGPFKFSWSKLHYRRMQSLEGLLDSSGKQIRACRNEFLKIGMLENMLIYLLELNESCEIVRGSEEGTPSEKKAQELEKKFEWMKSTYKDLKSKQKKNEELSKKIHSSKREINSDKGSTDSSAVFVSSSESEEKSPETFAEIAQKAMESILNSETLASSASEFETHIDSFKERNDMICKYIFRYSNDKLGELYKRRELETSFVLKIIGAFETLESVEDLKEAGRVMRAIMGLSKSKLTFGMMTKREKRQLRQLLQRISQVQPLVDVEEYQKKFKLPSN